jgi:hypothetical protein
LESLPMKPSVKVSVFWPPGFLAPGRDGCWKNITKLLELFSPIGVELLEQPSKEQK